MNKDMNEKDAELALKLCPPWRKMMLDIHKVITKTAAFVWSPVTVLLEEFNGTARWRAAYARMEAEERKKAFAKAS